MQTLKSCSCVLCESQYSHSTGSASPQTLGSTDYNGPTALTVLDPLLTLVSERYGNSFWTVTLVMRGDNLEAPRCLLPPLPPLQDHRRTRERKRKVGDRFSNVY